MTPTELWIFLKRAPLFFSLCKNVLDQNVEKVILLCVLQMQESK